MDEKVFSFLQNPNEVIDRVKNLLSLEVANKYSIPSVRSGQWDGVMRYYKNLTFDKPLVQFLKLHFNINFCLLDTTKRNFCDLSLEDLDERLRYYQKEAVLKALKKDFGILKVPTGGGKTFIASEIITQKIKKGQRVLFLVESVDLKNQSIGDFVNFGLDRKDIYDCNLEKDVLNCNKINVATIQTLISKTKNKKSLNYKKNVRELKSIDYLIIDECHEFKSDARLEFLKKFFLTKKRIALSATPFKSKDLKQPIESDFKLLSFLGSVIYEIEEEVLREEGFLSKTKVLLFHLKHKVNKHKLSLNKKEWYNQILNEVIIQNKERNRLLCELIRIFEKKETSTLILTQRIEHAENIKKMYFQLFGKELIYIDGSSETQHRETTKEKFKNGEIKILIASNIFKKGVNVPICKVLINAGGGKDESNFIQKRGRVLRTHKTKEDETGALLIDFIDEENIYFSEHSASRLSVYIDKTDEKDIEIVEYHNELSTLETTVFNLSLKEKIKKDYGI